MEWQMVNGKWKMEEKGLRRNHAAPVDHLSSTISPSSIYHLPFTICHSPRESRRAFTLTEVLVVIVIIVLILAMAMPAFRYMTGSRSEAGARNQIAAMLGRVRSEAIGLQTYRGVAFYTDASGQRAVMAIVAPITYPFGAWASNTFYPAGSYVTNGGNNYVAPADVTASGTFQASNWQQLPVSLTNLLSGGVAGYPSFQLYDQVPDTDLESLPAGVDVQLVNDNGNSATVDRYLHVGVIMFDSTGKLTSQPFVIYRQGLIGRAAYPGATFDIADNLVKPDYPLYSQFGLVLLDRDAFTNQNFPPNDPAIDGSSYGTTGSAPPSEADEENWLDQNASPLLINRYNGTLLQAQ